MEYEYYPSMETLVGEAVARDVVPSDIYTQGQVMVNTHDILEQIKAQNSQDYVMKGYRRVALNKHGDKFYDVLMEWLSEEIVKENNKLEPIKVRRKINKDGEWYEFEDGRHRIALNTMLGFEETPAELV